MMHRLELVLERLGSMGRNIGQGKQVHTLRCLAPYLGHIISCSGLEMDPAKVQKIFDINPVEICSIDKVRSFLGLCSYYRRFIKGFSRITAVLTDLTKDGVDVGEATAKHPKLKQPSPLSSTQ